VSERVLLVGGHGGPSGVPSHLRHLCTALEGHAEITVMHDVDRGGYGFAPRHLVQRGLATSLRPFAVWNAWRALRRAVRSGTYDIVWAHARLPVVLLRLGRAGGTRARLAVTYHGLPFEPGQRVWAAWAGLWLEAALLRLAPPMTLVVLSTGARARLVAALPRATQRHCISVLPNSSDLEVVPAYPRDRDRFRILMTGRACWQKNLPAALAMVPYLPARARLVLCGQGTQDLARGHPQIEGLGVQRDVRPHLARADLYLLTSRYEGLPIGALEAFQAGLPVAMPRGTCDLLDHHPLSVAIDPADPQAAARQITELWQAWAADPWAARAAIRAAWDVHYGFDQWQTQARAVFSRL
jgi:glycosyltransferase involved in cell wall biosynthesis